jgi:pimeloyl-ACP methyl ester carboxylesterase
VLTNAVLQLFQIYFPVGAFCGINSISPLSICTHCRFYLPKPRALNYLVTKAFGGPTLVLQGVKDPLNDAKGRAGEIGRLCSNAEVHLLDAGHCPHDEVPEAFNEALAAWVQRAIVVGKRNGQENEGVADQGRQVATNT